VQNSKGYLLGKLFAQLEREGAVRYEDYQVASMSPTNIIVPAFSRLAKMRKMDAIQDVMLEMPMDAFDGQVLSPSDQADFPLGYYHEKARWRRPEVDEEAAFDATLLVRLDSPLKQWTLEHGGSKLVRSLLRAERERQKGE
jgi:hypothetical protein